jgi:hypothetical protein
MEKIEVIRRPVGDMENDFVDLVASRLPLAIASEKFERLWDEVNSAATSLMSCPEVNRYVALLIRMQGVYESQYIGSTHMNGRHATPQAR